MTTSRQMDDSEGDFAEWKDHPDPCHKIVTSEATLGRQRQCGAKVQARVWESHDGAYEDYQYRCANGHGWWVDGSDS